MSLAHDCEQETFTKNISWHGLFLNVQFSLEIRAHAANLRERPVMASWILGSSMQPNRVEITQVIRSCLAIAFFYINIGRWNQSVTRCFSLICLSFARYHGRTQKTKAFPFDCEGRQRRSIRQMHQRVRFLNQGNREVKHLTFITDSCSRGCLLIAKWSVAAMSKKLTRSLSAASPKFWTLPWPGISR